MTEDSCTWFTLDKLDPISRFEFICKNHAIDYDLSCHIITALVAVDSALSNHVDRPYYLYVQDDASILWMLNNLSEYSFEHAQFERALLGIDFSKLIYRFTCARKFLVPNILTNQLRINSWGRYYWERELSRHYHQIYQKLYCTFIEYYKQHELEYTSLLEYLSSNVSPKTACEIQVLNKKLAVKLLA